IEWFHRLLALGVGLLLFATAGVALRARATRARLGGLARLAVALYFAQALLGALTVWRLLDPSVVSGHLALALLLFATLLTIALVARHESAQDAEPSAAPAAPGVLRALAATATVLTYAQAVLGGMVSTNHAGLACPDWPTCDGEWFPPLSGLVGLQMAHRDGAYLLLAVMAALAWRSRRAADPLVRRGGPLLLAFTLAQAALGVSNVLLGLPVWVSAMHLANAAMLLALGVAVTFRLAAQGAPAPVFAGAAAR
ncbi:MAG TPA: COX15/CtaA family protein, partial [Candidatus Eisenbacteria bacterium]|nr:COX15/CtaA family protein [Candidatus Eisenbacteria bacterium]